MASFNSERAWQQQQQQSSRPFGPSLNINRNALRPAKSLNSFGASSAMTGQSSYQSAKSTLTPSPEPSRTLTPDRDANNPSRSPMDDRSNNENLTGVQDAVHKFNKSTDRRQQDSAVKNIPTIPKVTEHVIHTSDMSEEEGKENAAMSPLPILHTIKQRSFTEFPTPPARSPAVMLPLAPASIRLTKKPSLGGFPFRSSVLIETDSFVPPMRGVPPLPTLKHRSHSTDVNSSRLKRHSDETKSSWRSSDDVDLDLSLDFPLDAYEEGGNGHFDDEEEEERGREEGHSNEYVSINVEPIQHDIPIDQLVRSESGRLMGTTRRVKSADGLRSLYRAGEGKGFGSGEDLAYSPQYARQQKGKGKAVSIREGSPSSARAKWEHRTSNDPSLNYGNLVQNAPSRKRESHRQAQRAELVQGPLTDPVLSTKDSSSTLMGKRSIQSFGQKISQRFPMSWRFGAAAGSAGSIVDSLNGSIVSSFEQTSSTEPIASPFDLHNFGSPTSNPEPLFDDQTSPRTMTTAPTTPADSPWTSNEQGDEDFHSYLHGRDRVQHIQEQRKEEIKGLGLHIPREAPLEPLKDNATVPQVSISPPEETSNGSYPSSSRESLSSNDSGQGQAHSPTRRLSYREESISEFKTRETATRGLMKPLAPPHRPQFGSISNSHLLVQREAVPEDVTSNQVRTKSAQFAFLPAPIVLVNRQNQTAGARNGIRQQTTVNKRPVSIASLIDFSMFAPAAILEEVVPSKLCFLAGFLLGPWCWIIGGWWLRPRDGELWRTHGSRCRGKNCNCGEMDAWPTVSAIRKHGKPTDPAQWRGLDQWVFINRASSLVSCLMVMVLFGLGLSVVVA